MAKPKAITTSKKTETLTLRLDPKMKFAIEMLARKQKRTLAGVIEWATSKAIENEQGGQFFTFSELIDRVWSSDDSTRFVNMAMEMPEALTYDELRIWETIESSPALWGMQTLAERGVGHHELDRDLLRVNWDELLEHVEKYKAESTLVPFHPPLMF